MVAYSFAMRFARIVESGAKTQTIRGHRKRHARPGEPVQLYTGMRTKACRKLVTPDPICEAVMAVTLDMRHAAVTLDDAPLPLDTLNDFAQADGFANFEDMRGWWQKTHGDAVFEGVLIRWKASA